MATKVFKFTKENLKKLNDGYLTPLNYTRDFLSSLLTKIDTDTQTQFQLEGGYNGRPKWRGYAVWFTNRYGHIAMESTKRTAAGTWKLRYGSWKKPNRKRDALLKYKEENKLFFKPGPMKGYRNDKRYGSDSKLLQASGTFRRSFKKITLTKDILRYGTKYEKAEKILSGGRGVLYMTDREIAQINSDFYTFFNKYLWSNL